jgi:hypothetical protein
MLLNAPVEVERVLALVNGVPVLASDEELAEIAALVPRQTGESDTDYRNAVIGALIDLELRWQDLNAAGVVQRTPIDMDAAWHSVVARVGGEQALHERLVQVGLDEALLKELLHRAAVVEAYVARRFAPFARPSQDEVEDAYRTEVVAPARQAGSRPPELVVVRADLESVLRERKLKSEIDRWTEELERRAEVIRYVR